MNTSLKGKKALICGASQGIGKAITLELAKEGCMVFPLARSKHLLQEILETVPKECRGEMIQIDLGNRDRVELEIVRIIETYESIDILINNSGGPSAGTIFEATEEAFLQGIQQHLIASSLLTKMIVPSMKINRWGRIINIISISVKTPIPNLGVSNTVRGAMASWAKTLATELAPFGITVNNVLPGYTDTSRLKELMTKTADKLGKTIDEIKQQWIETIPMGRLASAEEIAYGAVFLASPAASYITGTNLVIDGGRTPCL